MLETERVKKLIKSACQFSSAELFTAISLLKEKANDRQSKEYQEKLRAFANSLKPGDPITLDRNGHKIPYGSSGVVTEVELCRAPKTAIVYIDFGPHGEQGFYIRDLAKFGSISMGQIKTNRSFAKIITSL